MLQITAGAGAFSHFIFIEILQGWMIAADVTQPINHEVRSTPKLKPGSTFRKIHSFALAAKGGIPIQWATVFIISNSTYLRKGLKSDCKHQALIEYLLYICCSLLPEYEQSFDLRRFF